MRPALLDSLSWAMAEVYGSVTDRILINIARHFPYIHDGAEPLDLFRYQVKKLAEIGQLNAETVDIIASSLDGADAALRAVLEEAIRDALKDVDPILRKAAEQGLLQGPGLVAPDMAPGMTQAFRSYYAQSADKLNLVNTVMLESTEEAYRQCVSDITARIQRTQSIMNASAGEVIAGVSTWNEAMSGAVKKMMDNGLIGFVDHAGHHWSPEAYVAMDIRTTLHNTANAAVWERAEEYGSDIYQVSSHPGARPKCYPWQGKLISRIDFERDVEDVDGNTVHVHAQSNTSYGDPAGLFGVNCRHYPTPFIPGFSAMRARGLQDPEENEQTYRDTQTQRGLERALRKEKRDLAEMKARGVPADQIKAQQARVKEAEGVIQRFCDETGLPRRRNREYTPIVATFPDKQEFNPATVPRDVQTRVAEWMKGARMS